MKGDIFARQELAGMRREVVLALLLPVASGALWAGSGEWLSLGPKSGMITALAIDPQKEGTLYAGTASGGLFKSADGGATWRAANCGTDVHHVSALAIVPKPGGCIVFAGTWGDGVFKSADAGLKWTPAD